MDEAHEAARAIAALLDLAAVGIEDAIAEIDTRRAGARRSATGRSRRRNGGRPASAPGPASARSLVDGVEDDEIVAQAMHFGEADAHPARIRRTASADFRQLRGQ
jgi:hypothetical protein